MILVEANGELTTGRDATERTFAVVCDQCREIIIRRLRARLARNRKPAVAMANEREKSWNDLTDPPGKGAGPRFEASGPGNDLPTPTGCQLSGAATLSPLDDRALAAAAPASGEAADIALVVVIRTANEPSSQDCVSSLDG